MKNSLSTRYEGAKNVLNDDTKFRVDKETAGSAKHRKIEKAWDGSKKISSPKTPDPQEELIIEKRCLGSQTDTSPENIDKDLKSSILDEQTQGNQGMTMKSPYTENKDLTSKMSEADATEPKNYKSTLHAPLSYSFGNIATDGSDPVNRSRHNNAVNQKVSKNFSVKNSREEMEINATVLTKQKTLEDLASCDTDKTTLGATPRFLPRQANVGSASDGNRQSIRSSILGTTTTRFSPREVSEFHDRDDVTSTCGVLDIDEGHEANVLLPSLSSMSITKKRRKL